MFRFQRIEKLTHFEGGGHAANDSDGMLQTELLQLEAEGVFFVLQVDAGRRRQELFAGEADLRRIGRLRRWQLLRQDVEVTQTLKTNGSCPNKNFSIISS